MAKSVENRVPQEKLFLVYVNEDQADDDSIEAELEGLAEAAGGVAVGSDRQRVHKPFRATYLGSGKVGEIKSYAAETAADVVVVDASLSGTQIKNLADEIGVRVIDRAQLILDIFARRAHTKEGQLQVELAQMTYLLPRLMSVYTKFERQRGGIGMRGPGETKLESDRRMVNKRISKLKEEIEDVRRHRRIQRESRSRHPHPVVAIVGYTSAGKSTLMNRLSGAGVVVDAMPFATLDPTTRKVDLPDGFSFYLVDTVGFVRELPTELIAAFRATLEEVALADLLLHLVDTSNDNWEAQRDCVIDTIEQLGGKDVPMVTVFNKIDKVDDRTMVDRLLDDFPGSVAISAEKGEGVESLLQAVTIACGSRMERVTAIVPYDKTALIDACYKFGRVIKKDYKDEGVYLEADVLPDMVAKLREYAV